MKMNKLVSEMSKEELELWDQIPTPVPKWVKYEDIEEDEDDLLFESKCPILELEELNVRKDIEALGKSFPQEPEPKQVRTAWVEITSLDVFFKSDWNENVYPSRRNRYRHWYLNDGRIVRDWELQQGNGNKGANYLQVPHRYWRDEEDNLVEDTFYYKAECKSLTGKPFKAIINIGIDLPVYRVQLDSNREIIAIPVIYFDPAGKYIYNRFNMVSLKKAELLSGEKVINIERAPLEEPEEEAYELTSYEVIQKVNSITRQWNRNHYKAVKRERLLSKIEQVKEAMIQGKEIKNLKQTLKVLDRELQSLTL